MTNVMERKSLIQVENLSKVFGPKPEDAVSLLESGVDKAEILDKTGASVGVNRVSFEVFEGELFVLMGLSGSGKSTLLRCLNRLVDPTTGSITVDGRDITNLSKDELLDFRQKHMSMVFQQFALFPHKTVLENVAFGLEVQGVSREHRLEVAKEKLALVGLEKWGNQYPGNLSGGMQQRVGLARALANNPDILLMDEAFSALDPLIREDMQNELLLLQESLKKTIIFVTHDLSEALKIGDRIALMKDGEIVQVGTPDEIVNHPKNEYVERFVRGVDRTQVLTAGDIMKAPQPQFDNFADAQETLATMRTQRFQSAYIVNENKAFIGLLTLDLLSEGVSNGCKVVGECQLDTENTVNRAASMVELIQCSIRTNHPVAVLGDSNELLGSITKDNILAVFADGGVDDVAGNSNRSMD